MKRCNAISLDTDLLIEDLAKVALSSLYTEADQVMQMMRHEVEMTTDGGAPGKPEWRNTLRRNIGIVSTVITGDGIAMEVGYSPTGKADEVRAMVIGYGSGDKAEGGGEKIHAGPTGRSVWDDDLSAKRPSRAKTSYVLPDAFNQQGNQFVDNAMRRMQSRFGNSAERAVRSLPDGVYHRKTRVRT